jgi:hypothetical protein
MISGSGIDKLHVHPKPVTAPLYGACRSPIFLINTARNDL